MFPTTQRGRASRTSTRTAACVLPWLLAGAIAGCSGGRERAALAAQGQIHESAPVKATVRIIIAAPVSKIWRLLSDIDRWPYWQEDIGAAQVTGTPGIGTTFTWSMNGMTIHSVVQRFDAEKSLCWTGRTLHIHAIHCWTMIALPNGQTSVTMSESLDGWLLAHFMSSQDLHDSNEKWLRRLKHAAQ